MYERFGPLLFTCDVPEYSVNLALDELDAEYASVYISEEQQAITVSLFIYGPRFHIPLKLPEGTAKTPERVLIEQPVDADHGDEEQSQFIYYAPLGSVSSPGFDADRQIVTGWARSWAAGGTHSFYCWMDGELVLVREINIDFTKMIVVKDLIDGQMIEVYREEWEEKDEGDVLDILYKWYDLDYHDESTEEDF